jgi:hypothetical protein
MEYPDRNQDDATQVDKRFNAGFIKKAYCFMKASLKTLLQKLF